MELSGGVKQCLFDIEKYKVLNEEEDLKMRASRELINSLPANKLANSAKNYTLEMRKLLSQEKKLREKSNKEQYKQDLAIIRMKKKELTKHIMGRKKKAKIPSPRRERNEIAT